MKIRSCVLLLQKYLKMPIFIALAEREFDEFSTIISLFVDRF